MTPAPKDYTAIVSLITNVSIAFAVLAFIVSMLIEHNKERKKASASNTSIAQPLGDLITHIGRSTAAAALPAAMTLIYSAFDVDILPHMLSIHYWIAIAGLTLLFTSMRMLLK